jgi:hypothetical protein
MDAISQRVKLGVKGADLRQRREIARAQLGIYGEFPRISAMLIVTAVTRPRMFASPG